MKLRITPPGGEPRDYEFTALEQAPTSAMFALQRATGKIMPKELEILRDARDALTLLYYTAWLILWRAGDKTDLEALYECELDVVQEPGDVVVEEAAEEESDPTTPPEVSDPGESAEE